MVQEKVEQEANEMWYQSLGVNVHTCSNIIEFKCCTCTEYTCTCMYMYNVYLLYMYMYMYICSTIMC